MDREELQSLSLDELRLLAEQRGVAHARHLPRSRIVDELGGPGSVHHPIGLKGRVAELLHRLDRALSRSLGRLLSHPTAAKRPPAATPEKTTAASQGSGEEARPPAEEVVYQALGHSSGHRMSSSGAVRGPHACAAAVDRANLSEDMARTYAAEGHRDEAVAIYRLLLLERPGDPDLLSRLAELEKSATGEERPRSSRPKLGPSATGPQSEPWGMLDLEELPEVYGVNEVEVLFKDPWWSFVYWEVTDAGIEAARQQLGASSATARLVLRMFTTQPAHGTASRETRDVPLTWNHGRRYLDIPRPGGLLRVAIGLLSAEGYFAPIAHSSLLRLPPPHPSATMAVDWMQVAPPRSRGEVRERITIVTRSAVHRERSLPWRVAAMVPPPGSVEPGEAVPGNEETASYPPGPAGQAPGHSGAGKGGHSGGLS